MSTEAAIADWVWKYLLEGQQSGGVGGNTLLKTLQRNGSQIAHKPLGQTNSSQQKRRIEKWNLVATGKGRQQQQLVRERTGPSSSRPRPIFSLPLGVNLSLSKPPCQVLFQSQPISCRNWEWGKIGTHLQSLPLSPSTGKPLFSACHSKFYSLNSWKGCPFWGATPEPPPPHYWEAGYRVGASTTGSLQADADLTLSHPRSSDMPAACLLTPGGKTALQTLAEIFWRFCCQKFPHHSFPVLPCYALENLIHPISSY